MDTDRFSVTEWNSRDNKMTLSGIPKELQEKFEGMTHGQYWVKGENGKLIFQPAREPLPKPAEDTDMLPFWRRATTEEMRTHQQEILFEREKFDTSCASIQIQSLCGYYYTPEKYRKTAELLESYGFKCLRSKRGNDGKYWEVWYLPGLWCAQGNLKETIGEYNRELNTEEQRLEKALSFLGRTISFGILDVSVQRMAMVMED